MFDVDLKVSLGIRGHSLRLTADIDFASNNFGDKGLAVFFEELDFLLFF
jgi:hypothetical protein